MTQAALLPLLAVLALLLLAGACGLAPLLRNPAAAAMAPLCAAGAALGLAALVGGGAGATVVLPLGVPGAGMTLGIDPLSGLFLGLLLGPAATSGFRADPARVPGLAAAAASLMLVLLARDRATLALGFGLAAPSVWTARGGSSRAVPLLVASGAGAVALAAALALLPPAQAAGPVAILVAILMLLAVAPLAGLVPLHGLVPADRGARGPALPLLRLGGTMVAVYLLLRVLLGLAGPALPDWCGVPLLLAGAATAPVGAARMLRAPGLAASVAFAPIAFGGMAVAGIGTALIARAADLPDLAALAVASVLLLAVAQALATTLLLLGADRVVRAAGTWRLDRMGGLLARMPATGTAMLAAAASLAALPPSAGFAAIWLLLQALIGAARAADFGTRIALAASMAGIALALGLQAAAALRLVGIALLGRPRTPRAAAAEEVSRPGRLALLGLAALGLLPGLLPGPTLGLLGPAVRRLLGSGLDGQATGLAVAAQTGGAGYSAPLVVALLLGTGAAAGLVLRRPTPLGARRAPAWEGGFEAPPPWLPFGDPLTQIGPAALAQMVVAPFVPLQAATRRLRAGLRGRRPWLPRLRTGAPLAGTLAVVAALLLLAAAWAHG